MTSPDWKNSSASSPSDKQRRGSAPTGVGSHREVDWFLRAHQLYGTAPLDQSGRDGYVADTARVASALGIPDPPAPSEKSANGSRPSGPSCAAQPPRVRRPDSFCSLHCCPLPPGRLRTGCRHVGDDVAVVGAHGVATAILPAGRGHRDPRGRTRAGRWHSMGDDGLPFVIRV